MKRIRNRKSNNRHFLPRFNWESDRCDVCAPGRPLEYVAVRRSDRARRPGLTLLAQDWRCRRFAIKRLHRRIDSAYLDTPSTHRLGLRRLLARLKVCGNRRVVVSRFDRLPETRHRLFGGLAVRVLSATELNQRGRSRVDELTDIRRTIHELFDQNNNHKGEKR